MPIICEMKLEKGAHFCPERKYRFALFRIWDSTQPLVMFVGLNPSTANEDTNDATIRSVMRIALKLGYGGIYMMNCFPYISTDPRQLKPGDSLMMMFNDSWLNLIGLKCKTVVFAWGNFSIVKDTRRDLKLMKMFPEAKVLGLNKNGSPKHPLYVPSNVTLLDFIQKPI